VTYERSRGIPARRFKLGQIHKSDDDRRMQMTTDTENGQDPPVGKTADKRTNCGEQGLKTPNLAFRLRDKRQTTSTSPTAPVMDQIGRDVLSESRASDKHQSTRSVAQTYHCISDTGIPVSTPRNRLLTVEMITSGWKRRCDDDAQMPARRFARIAQHHAV